MISRRKKGKKVIRKEVKTDMLDKYEFVTGGAKSLTRQINALSTTINYYLINFAAYFHLK